MTLINGTSFSGCGVATIDVGTGGATIVGNTAVSCQAGNAFTFDSTDTLLLLDDGGITTEAVNRLHVLNPLTGGAISTTYPSIEGFPTPVEWLRANSMDVDPVTGTVFVTVKDGSGSSGPDYLGTLSGTTVSYVGASVKGLKAIAVAPPVLIECVGFEAPMDNYPVRVKKNRVLPLKAQLFDAASRYELTDADLTPPPVVQVWYEHGSSEVEDDVSGDALPAGKGDDGNEFVFTDEGKWQFNLKTSNYSASGTYTIFMESGDNTTYVFGPTCETQFVIK